MAVCLGNQYTNMATSLANDQYNTCNVFATNESVSHLGKLAEFFVISLRILATYFSHAKIWNNFVCTVTFRISFFRDKMSHTSSDVWKS